MLKKHMAACIVASAFITMPALAQTCTSPSATSPGATQPATGASGGSGAATSGGKFITEQQQNQWRASRLIGIDVYGADNNKIGDINEVLVDRQGNADAVVVGVGGFLGIGEKNVALPFSAFEWQMDDSRRTASASGTGAGAGRTSTTAADATTAGAAGAGATATGTTATTGAGTGAAGSPASTASTGSAGSSSARSSAERGYPDHAVLRMSKADLENAPTFRYVGETRSDTSGSGGAARTGSSSTTGTGAGTSTAPRQ